MAIAVSSEPKFKVAVVQPTKRAVKETLSEFAGSALSSIESRVDMVSPSLREKTAVPSEPIDGSAVRAMATRLGEVSASCGTRSRSPQAPSWPGRTNALTLAGAGDLVTETARCVDGRYSTAEENAAQPADGENHRSPSRARVLDDDQGESSACDTSAIARTTSLRLCL